MKVSVENGKLKVVLTEEEKEEAFTKFVNERGYDLTGAKVEYQVSQNEFLEQAVASWNNRAKPNPANIVYRCDNCQCWTHSSFCPGCGRKAIPDHN